MTAMAEAGGGDEAEGETPLAGRLVKLVIGSGGWGDAVRSQIEAQRTQVEGFRETGEPGFGPGNEGGTKEG